MANEVRVRLKAPPKRGRGRSAMAAGLRHALVDGAEAVATGSCGRGLRTATRKPLLMARSLTLSSSRSLLAVTTMLFLAWQSRMITSVLGAVCPAVVLEFCISDRHLKIDNRRIPKREAVATSAVYQMSPPRGGLIYERATAKVFQYVGRAKKKPRDVSLGCFRRPCVMISHPIDAANIRLISKIQEKSAVFSALFP